MSEDDKLGHKSRMDLTASVWKAKKLVGKSGDKVALLQTRKKDKYGRLVGDITTYERDGDRLRGVASVSNDMLMKGDSNVWFGDKSGVADTQRENAIIDSALSTATANNSDEDWARYENLVQKSGLSAGEKERWLNPDIPIGKIAGNTLMGTAELTSKAVNWALEALYSLPDNYVEKYVAGKGRVDDGGLNLYNAIKPYTKQLAELGKAPTTKEIERAFKPIRESLNSTFSTDIFSKMDATELPSVAKAVHDAYNGRIGSAVLGIANATTQGFVNAENVVMLIPFAGMGLLIAGKAKEFEDDGAGPEKALGYAAAYALLNKLSLHASLGQIKAIGNRMVGKIVGNTGTELLTENMQSILELDAAGKIKSVADVIKSIKHTSLETLPNALFGGASSMVEEDVRSKFKSDVKRKLKDIWFSKDDIDFGKKKKKTETEIRSEAVGSISEQFQTIVADIQKDLNGVPLSGADGEKALAQLYNANKDKFTGDTDESLSESLTNIALLNAYADRVHKLTNPDFVKGDTEGGSQLAYDIQAALKVTNNELRNKLSKVIVEGTAEDIAKLTEGTPAEGTFLSEQEDILGEAIDDAIYNEPGDSIGDDTDGVEIDINPTKSKVDYAGLDKAVAARDRAITNGEKIAEASGSKKLKAKVTKAKKRIKKDKQTIKSVMEASLYDGVKGTVAKIARLLNGAHLIEDRQEVYVAQLAAVDKWMADNKVTRDLSDFLDHKKDRVGTNDKELRKKYYRELVNNVGGNKKTLAELKEDVRLAKEAGSEAQKVLDKEIAYKKGKRQKLLNQMMAIRKDLTRQRKVFETEGIPVDVTEEMLLNGTDAENVTGASKEEIDAAMDAYMKRNPTVKLEGSKYKINVRNVYDAMNGGELTGAYKLLEGLKEEISKLENVLTVKNVVDDTSTEERSGSTETPKTEPKKEVKLNVKEEKKLAEVNGVDTEYLGLVEELKEKRTKLTRVEGEIRDAENVELDDEDAYRTELQTTLVSMLGDVSTALSNILKEYFSHSESLKVFSAQHRVLKAEERKISVEITKLENEHAGIVADIRALNTDGGSVKLQAKTDEVLGGTTALDSEGHRAAEILSHGRRFANWKAVVAKLGSAIKVRINGLKMGTGKLGIRAAKISKAIKKLEAEKAGVTAEIKGVKAGIRRERGLMETAGTAYDRGVSTYNTKIVNDDAATEEDFLPEVNVYNEADEVVSTHNLDRISEVKGAMSAVTAEEIGKPKETKRKRVREVQRKKKMLKSMLKRIEKKLQDPKKAKELLRQDGKATGKDGGPSVRLSDYVRTVTKAASALAVASIDTLIGSMGPKSAIAKYGNIADDFIKDAKLMDMYIKMRSRADEKGVSRGYAQDSPAQELMIGADGQFDKQAVVAAIIAAEQHVRDKGNKLFMKSDSDIEREMGVPEGTASKEQLAAFRTKTKRHMISLTIGTTAMKHLGLTAKETGDQEAYDRLVANLGTVGTLYLLKTGNVLEEVSMGLNEYNDIMGRTTSDEDRKANEKLTVPMVTTKGGKRLEGLKIAGGTIEDLKERVKKIEKDGVVELGGERAYRTPPKAETPESRGILRSFLSIPAKILNNAMNVLEAQEHETIMDAVEMLAELDRDVALKAMGWKDPKDIEKSVTMLASAKESALAANIEKEVAYDELMAEYADIKSGAILNAAWFKYDAPTNMRMNMRATGLSPQTEKELHRWLVVAKNTRKVYKVSAFEGDGKGSIGFRLGVAQAFGFDIDKRNVKSALIEADKLMAMSKDELIERIKTEDIDHLGHALQAIQAIKGYRDAVRDGKTSFETIITQEYDGISNGVMLNYLALAVGSNAAEILAKGAFIFKGVENSGNMQAGIKYEDFNGMLEEFEESRRLVEEGKEGKVLDVYLTQSVKTKISQKTLEVIDTVLDTFGLVEDGVLLRFMPDVSEALSKEMRELFKDPTMVTQYGASLERAIKNIGYNAMEKGLTKALVAYHSKESDVGYSKEDKDAAEVLFSKLAKGVRNEEGYVANAAGFAARLAKTELSRIKLKDGKSTLEDSLHALYTEAVGKEAGKSLRETFGGVMTITETINVASRTIFRLFERALEVELEKVKKRKKIANKAAGIVGSALSAEEIQEAVKVVADILPVVKSPLSEGMADSVVIMDLATMAAGGLEYSNTSLKYENTSMTARTFSRKIVEAYAAAGVLLTHAEDSADMATTLSAHPDKGLLGIHDAISVSGEDGQIVLKTMNRNIVDISRNYSRLNEWVTAMERSVKKFEALGIDVNVDELIPLDSEKKGKRATGYSVEGVMTELRETAEGVWMDRERLFANDVKVDQMPGYDSMVEYKAEFVRRRYIDELIRRIERRVKTAGKGSEYAKMFGTKKDINSFVKAAFAGVRSKDVTARINEHLDIIDSITTILEGEC